MAVDSVFAHWADARAEKADISGVALMNLLPSQVLLFVISFVPVFLLALNGPAYVNDALKQPARLVHQRAGNRGRHPARDRHRAHDAVHLPRLGGPYFFIGFILFTLTAVPCHWWSSPLSAWRSRTSI